jgi:hypothetical protein
MRREWTDELPREFPDVSHSAMRNSTSSVTSTSGYEETGGKVGHDWNDTQVLILHATGEDPAPQGCRSSTGAAVTAI